MPLTHPRHHFKRIMASQVISLQSIKDALCRLARGMREDGRWPLAPAPARSSGGLRAARRSLLAGRLDRL
jgi:hypothetical protein